MEFLLYLVMLKDYLSCAMRNTDFCLGENKGADQHCSNCEADQRLCFRYKDSTNPLLKVKNHKNADP